MTRFCGAYGFGNDNDGLLAVDSPVSAGDSVSVAAAGITVAVSGGDLAAPAGYLSLAGVRLPGKSGATWAWDSTAGEATLTYANHGLDNDRGLYEGMIVHFGSVTAAGEVVENAIDTATPPVVTGFARVKTIGTTIIFDRVDEALQVASMAIATGDLDLLFGDFIRNVSRSDDDYVQRSHTIELSVPDLFEDGSNAPNPVANPDGYEYAVGQVIGTLVLNFPLTDKATMTVNFVGQDTDTPSATRVTDFPGATPARAGAMNTSADFARLEILDVDDDGITSDFKSLTLTINPQTSPEKVLGKLGARFINRGNLLIDVGAQVIFSDAKVLNAIRQNETVSFSTIIGNEDGVFHFAVPSMTLGGGGREYPANQAVLVNATGESFEDETFATSIHVSFIPVPVPTAI